MVPCGSHSLAFLFFFSSRRRHTRSLRDWSSDVCSSDLSLTATVSTTHKVAYAVLLRYQSAANGADAAASGHSRSEERRVGKECRSPWSPRHEQKTGTDH